MFARCVLLLLVILAGCSDSREERRRRKASQTTYAPAPFVNPTKFVMPPDPEPKAKASVPVVTKSGEPEEVASKQEDSKETSKEAATAVVSSPPPTHYRTRSGPVEVRGYTTKNGTYVAPYTRAAPGTSTRSGGGRRR